MELSRRACAFMTRSMLAVADDLRSSFDFAMHEFGVLLNGEELCEIKKVSFEHGRGEIRNPSESLVR